MRREWTMPQEQGSPYSSPGLRQWMNCGTNMSETMDYKSTGGAMLLGINGVVVKAHGNSDAYSFKSALKVTKQMVDYQVVNNIKESLKNE